MPRRTATVFYMALAAAEPPAQTEGGAPALGPYSPGEVAVGDCRELVAALPDDSVDILVTSPPYWGQRQAGGGNGGEEDPRCYLDGLMGFFGPMLSKLKPDGIAWVNLGDSYNTPVNWTAADKRYSTLGADGTGAGDDNSAYVKPRGRRRAFIDSDAGWLSYGNMLALPQRLAVRMCDAGWLLRGEASWVKPNPLPEGRCRRMHRQHEPVMLFARSERHQFRVSPPVGTVWRVGSDHLPGLRHWSRFPVELARLCIEAYGRSGSHTVVLDPYAGSGSTGLAAAATGCIFAGFEIDPAQAEAATQRIADAASERQGPR